MTNNTSEKENSNMSPIYNTTNKFQLPIQYNKHKKQVSSTIIKDLELYKVYETFLSPQTTNDLDVMKDLVEYYTTDVEFLQDTQTLVSKYECQPQSTDLTSQYHSLVEFITEMNLENYYSKYGLIDYSAFHFMNNMEYVLLVLTIYVMISPIISISTPLLMFIIPFFVLQYKHGELKWNCYLELLKDIGKNNSLIKILTQYHKLNLEQKTYQLITFSFYVFSIYQQCIYGYKFISNLKNAYDYLSNLKCYVETTIQNMRHFISRTHELKTYKKFNQSVGTCINSLLDLYTLLEPIEPFNWNIKSMMNVGYVLKTLYILKTNVPQMDSVLYAMSFNSYFRYIETMSVLYIAGKINISKLLKERKPIVKFKQVYYPPLSKQNNIVKNTVIHDKNIIITGPNASGKTTLIKTLFINVLHTQQFGLGFYEQATLTPFKYLHCYLNIPDTMERDSLFEAEARRCKEIIDSIETHKDGKHYCMFDELFSGTNPEEAIQSSKGFIKFITHRENVKWVLTTHFIQLCKQLNKHPQIQNCHMNVVQTKNSEGVETFEYTYKLKPKISTIKGAFKILSDMNFPKEIIDNSLVKR
jgi:MutS domain V